MESITKKSSSLQEDLWSVATIGAAPIEGCLAAMNCHAKPGIPKEMKEKMTKLTITELGEWRDKFAIVDGTVDMKTLADEFEKEFNLGTLKGFEIYHLLRGSESFYTLLWKVME